MADGVKLSNLERIKARLAAIPAAVKAANEVQLETNVGTLVTAQKRAASAQIGATKNERERRLTGELVDKIRAEKNPRRELSYTVICDPKDEEGHGYAPHFEFGHEARDGTHVRARPSFFPAYRAPA